MHASLRSLPVDGGLHESGGALNLAYVLYPPVGHGGYPRPPSTSRARKIAASRGRDT